MADGTLHLVIGDIFSDARSRVVAQLVGIKPGTLTLDLYRCEELPVQGRPARHSVMSVEWSAIGFVEALERGNWKHVLVGENAAR